MVLTVIQAVRAGVVVEQWEYAYRLTRGELERDGESIASKYAGTAEMRVLTGEQAQRACSPRFRRAQLRVL